MILKLSKLIQNNDFNDRQIIFGAFFPNALNILTTSSFAASSEAKSGKIPGRGDSLICVSAHNFET